MRVTRAWRGARRREEYRIWARLEPDGPEWKSIQSQHSSPSPSSSSSSALFSLPFLLSSSLSSLCLLLSLSLSLSLLLLARASSTGAQWIPSNVSLYLDTAFKFFQLELKGFLKFIDSFRFDFSVFLRGKIDESIEIIQDQQVDYINFILDLVEG